LKVVQVPLNLDLSRNEIGEAGAKFLAEATKVAQVPLNLDLDENKIGEAGARLFSEAIKVAQFTLNLNLSRNEIGEAGAVSLAQSLKVAQVPLTLNLGGNRIGEAGAEIIAEAIKVARVPLNLNLIFNHIEEAGTRFLSKAIKVAQFPLNLDLSRNKIGDGGAGLLAEAIKEARVPIILGLDFKKEYLGVTGGASIHDAQKDNFIIDAGLYPSKFLCSIEFSPTRSVLEQALGFPSVLAKLIQGYIGDVDLAWTDVAAIRAIEGASIENKYSNINYELLAAAYPTPPVVGMAPGLVLDGEQMEDDGQEERSPASQRSLAEDLLRSRKRKKTAEQQGFKGQGTLGYVVDNYPEYYDSGLDQVLKLRISGLTNAISLRPRYFGNEFGYKAWRLASDIGAILSQGKQVVVPINVDNKHWLGLLFKGFGDRVEVTYMDSEQRAMLPRLREELEHGFAMNSYQSSFLTAKLQPQRYNNCGFEVIENFVHYLTGTRATQGGVMYVHSLLVENSLLDPEIYGLKLEQNTKLIRFLSNAEPIAINEITLFTEQGGETKHERTVPNGNSLAKLTTDFYRASILFKTLDFVVDSARLAQEPSLPALNKLALAYAQLQAMVSGANSYSAMIAGTEALYQLQLGEYQQAFNIASTTISAMALPVILAMANRPYLGVAYGAWIATSTAYGAITNAYSFATELGSSDATLRSAVAYKNLAEWLMASPLQTLHDFGAEVQEYKLQINDLLFEKEKAIIQAQVKDEFGQKVFDYIYMPELIEKYVLLNDVIIGKLTEEEAQSLKSKPITISYGALEYDHCVKVEDYTKLEEETEHYYCCNIAGQVLDHVALTDGSLEVLKNL
jgi:hypothetical protein